MYVYSITNHKGGVGKTTAAATLGAAMAQTGRRILLIDLDPQASLTACVGAGTAMGSTEDMLGAPETIETVIAKCASGMSIVPARATLAIKLLELMRGPAPCTHLADALKFVGHRFDNVLIDCPSNIGAAMTNALTASDAALVPIQCNFLSLRGLADIQAVCSAIQQTTNRDLTVYAFASLYDARTAHSGDVLAEARHALGRRMLATIIPRSVRIAEAPATGETVLDYAPRSRGADAYRELALELLEKERHLGKTRRYPSRDTSTSVQLERASVRSGAVAAASS